MRNSSNRKETRPPTLADSGEGTTSSRSSRGADRRRDLAETLGGNYEGAFQQLLVFDLVGFLASGAA